MKYVWGDEKFWKCMMVMVVRPCECIQWWWITHFKMPRVENCVFWIFYHNKKQYKNEEEEIVRCDHPSPVTGTQDQRSSTGWGPLGAYLASRACKILSSFGGEALNSPYFWCLFSASPQSFILSGGAEVLKHQFPTKAISKLHVEELASFSPIMCFKIHCV